MNSKESKQPSILRGLGQRSLTSFQLVTSSKDSKEDAQAKAIKKDSRISLSEFLDRKLEKASSTPSKTVQGKQKPFSSIVGGQDKNGSIQGLDAMNKGRKIDSLLGDDVLKQFKQIRKEREVFDCSSSGIGEYTASDMQVLRKSKNPFEISKGGDENLTTPRSLVVLGDDPKPKRRGREEIFIKNKRPRPLFNHYANGSGWWDCNMEGIDSEEVGCNEVWEGMGSTTLGGLEWH